MHRLLLLGQARLVGPDGQPSSSAAAQPRRVALLAVLGRLAPKPVSRERLIGWFWPDAGEERARRSLNQALYALRTELGSEQVLLGQRDIRLNLDLVSCDVAEFTNAVETASLEQAAGLYQGPFLSDFQISGAPDFSQWVEQERTTLAQQYLDLLESLAGRAEQQGDLTGAVSWWKRAASADPVSARLAERLMRALAASGDRTGAIRHAEIYEAIVRQQFELPPDPAVMGLAETLRRGGDVGPVTPVSRPKSSAHTAPAPDTPTPVVRLAVTAPPAATTHVAPPVPAPSLPGEARVAPGRRRFGARTLGGIGLLVMIGAAVAIWLSRGNKTVPGETEPVVAVLPLENATGDSAFNLVGGMVTDWLTHELALTALVRVIDWRTLQPASGELPSVTDVGATLVLHGRVFRDGDSLRFMIQIADGRTGQVRMPVAPVSAPVGEPSVGLPGLQQQVTGALAQLVDPRLNNFAAASSRPPTWAAYQEFLLGLRSFGRPYHTSLGHFLRAAQLDSGYTQAELWVGNTLANLRRYREADSVFRRVSERREQLAPYDQANLDFFYGGYVRGDWETSWRGAEAMVALGPRAGHALWAVGHTARFTNRPRQALRALSRIELESGWGREWAPRILGEMGRDHHLLGEHEQELERVRQALRFLPDDGWVRTNEVIALAALRQYNELAQRVEAAMVLPETPSAWETYSGGDLLMQVARELAAHGAPADTSRRYAEAAVAWYEPLTATGTADSVHLLGHARAAETAGRYEAARELYGRLVAINPASPEFMAGAAVAAARLGDTAAAEEGLRQLRALDRPYHFGYPARWAANVAAVLGRREEAVRLLAESLKQGQTWLFRWHADPDLAALGDYRPFRELIHPR